MPNRDATGPLGQGPATGWGMGPCGGGWRRIGRGFGKFWRFGSQVTPAKEKEMLEEEVKGLEEELKAVKSRISELNK